MFDILISNFPYLLEGLGVALVLLAALLVLGIVLGLLIALLQVYGPRCRWLRPPIFVLDRFFRGVPIIFMFLLFYYACAGLDYFPPFALWKRVFGGMGLSYRL